MQRAIAIAHDGPKKRTGGPFGAVVVKDGTVIGEGSNCVTSMHDPTACRSCCDTPSVQIARALFPARSDASLLCTGVLKLEYRSSFKAPDTQIVERYVGLLKRVDFGCDADFAVRGPR